MRKILTINLLIACLILPACTDHVGTVVTDKAGPEAPINDPDSGVFNPSEPAAGGDDPVAGNTGGSTNAGGTGGGNSGGTGQGSSGSGTQPGGGGSPAGGGGGNPGGEPGGGNSGGQPVPEPGTLLLVGSGLAGIGASLLRRRRRREDGQGANS